MGKLSECVDASLEWTGTVLFRPFRLKKWIILAFIGMMSGSIASGNFRLNHSFPPKDTTSSAVQSSSHSAQCSLIHPRTAGEFLRQLKITTVKYIRLIVLLGTSLLLLTLVMMWLIARFYLSLSKAW